ncbi:MAG: DegT/DnrJ/EryC1/StrS family aminotransferase, partial [Pirellulales bacterium]|nr:DegT/DnrJ/EryC1/StrS family aminotransferase [Pirellulales bacterium]
MSHTVADEQLAILGGALAVPDSDRHDELFRWPIVTGEDEQAVLDVLRNRTMSDIDITTQFEAEYARYNGSRYALSYPNGTLALQVAMWAVGLRRGDEMICPSITYWASAAPALALGAAVAFADIDPVSLCLDPGDIQRHIGPRTRAIMVVHYCGHPADMDPILEIAQKHNLAVIEDVSHAHGALYKGRMVGSFGNVSATSMMTLKSFAIGEAGMLLTDDQEIHQRAIAFAHYRRHDQLTFSEVKPFRGVPL